MQVAAAAAAADIVVDAAGLRHLQAPAFAVLVAVTARSMIDDAGPV